MTPNVPWKASLPLAVFSFIRTNGGKIETTSRKTQCLVSKILVIKQIGLPLRSHLILLITRMNTDRIGLHSVLLPLLNNNNGNFICVFECTIVNLATYRQFTNAAWDWIIHIKREEKKRKEKKINIALSRGYPNSYFYNKWCNMLL